MLLPVDAEAGDVIQYAKDAKTDWQSQRKVDDDNRDMYLQKHVIPVTVPDYGSKRERADTNEDIEPIGLGRGSLIVDQDCHLISVMWTHRVNPAGTSPEAQNHASKLEKFADASALRMEELAPVPQLPKLRKDLVLYDRAILVILPNPGAWSGDRFLQREDESNEEYQVRYDLELRRSFPISWRVWSAPDCYFRWYGDGEYALVRYRSLRVNEILASYPGQSINLKNAVDGGMNSSQKVDIIDYLDNKWYGMFNVTNADELRRWEHYMGVNPAVLFTGNVMPENDEVQWGGAPYHSRHAVKAHDEAISNMLTNLRRDTRALTIVEHDPKIETGGEARGRPEKTVIKPGGQADIWLGEKISRLGAAASNTDYGPVISQLHSSIEDTGLRRVFMGQVKSDVTGTATRLAGEFAQLEMNDIAQGIRTGARKAAIRIFHAVTALEEAVKDLRQESTPDKVYVRYEDKNKNTEEIAVAPKDVENYDDLVQARWELRTPSDQRSMIDMLRLMAEDRPGIGPMIDMWGARERAGIEDPERIDILVGHQRARNSPENIAFINRLWMERLMGIISGNRENLTPEDVMALEAYGLDPEILQALIGEPPMVPPEQGGDSMVPSENAMRLGEQEAVQQPR